MNAIIITLSDTDGAAMSTWIVREMVESLYPDRPVHIHLTRGKETVVCDNAAIRARLMALLFDVGAVAEGY